MTRTKQALGALACAGALLAGCGSEKTTVVERTTTVIKPAPQTAPPPRPHATVAAAPVALTGYTASLYTARVPAEWSTETDDAQKSGFLESKWRSPDGSGASVLIDAVEEETLSPADKADQVRAATSRSAGYSEISFGPTTLGGQDAWRWVFDVSGDRRVDYFVNDCGVGLAVLGSTSPAGFDALSPTVKRVAKSVTADCTTPGPSPTPTEPSGCDPNYVGACVPTDQGDVNCGDLSESDFESVGTDPDELDADRDGIACES